MQENLYVNHKRALITGASAGIGLEYARALARKNCNLVIVSNQKSEIESLARSMRKEYGIEVIDLCMDLAVQEASSTLFQFCKQNNLQIDILINNAGIFLFRDIIETNEKSISTMLMLHVFTPTMLCRLFGEDMAQRGSGYILNMSSIASEMPIPGIAIYNSTKSYIKNFSISLHNELQQKGVNVITIRPGAVCTNLYNLPEKYKRLGRKIGILMPADSLALKALKSLSQNRCDTIPHPWLNLPFIWIIKSLPNPIVRIAKQKIDSFLQKQK